MDIDIFLMLLILTFFFTVLIPVLLSFGNKDDAEGGLRGMAFLFSIFALFLWIALAANSLSLTYSYNYVVDGIFYTEEVVYGDMTPVALLFAGVSIIPLLFTIYLIPESWKDALERPR